MSGAIADFKRPLDGLDSADTVITTFDDGDRTASS